MEELWLIGGGEASVWEALWWLGIPATGWWKLLIRLCFSSILECLSVASCGVYEGEKDGVGLWWLRPWRSSGLVDGLKLKSSFWMEKKGADWLGELVKENRFQVFCEVREGFTSD